METQRLVEICQGLPSPGSRKITQYCQKLIGELGLSSTEIEATKLEPSECQDEVAVLRKKIVKAVLTKLRTNIYTAASQKGLVTIGQPLPRVGYWATRDRILLKLSESGMFIIPQDNDTGKTTHCDPVKSPEFLRMLQV